MAGIGGAVRIGRTIDRPQQSGRGSGDEIDSEDGENQQKTGQDYPEEKSRIFLKKGPHEVLLCGTFDPMVL